MHEPEALAKLIKICNENRAYHSWWSDDWFW
jgi:hypothetical protein